ncbi:MAG: hypothetical protein OEW21_18635 [Betaproteobacteria bacterium]|nr:hypothetical protein [Betaproteobacteria bacterium]
MDDLRDLVEKNRSAQAYALGRSHSEEFGRGEFDFYFGIAAIDTGHAGEGVLALERYLLQFPENIRARLELARGYFVLGELPRAREEFAAVSRGNPPPGVQATIDRFMDSIRAQESSFQPSANAYAEVGGGIDSNVNSGIGGSSINVPTLGTVQLPGSASKSGDRFMHLGAGGQYTRPVLPGISLFAGANYENKFNAHSELWQFNQQNLGVYGGGSWRKDHDLWRATVSYSSMIVDVSSFREVAAVGAEWQRQMSELSSLSFAGQYATLRYPGSDIRNANYYGASAGWRRAFVHSLQPVIQLQGTFGWERDPIRQDLSRAIRSLRVGAGLTPAPKWALSAGVTYAGSSYLATDPLFLKTRSDGYVGIDAGLSYRVARRATLRAEFLHSANASSLPLYSYDRNVLTCKLRFELP